MDWQKRALAFSTFIFWLIAFPMDGFLLPGDKEEHLMLFFLIPHILSLLSAGLLAKGKWVDKISQFGVGISVIATAMFPFIQSAKEILLIFAGIGGAIMIIRSMVILKNSSNPLLSSAWGLSLGNAFVSALSYIPAYKEIKFFIVAVPLFSLLFPRHEKIKENENKETLKGYIPLFFIFYLTGGLFYGSLISHYNKLVFLKGLDLFFYVIAAPVAAILLKKGRDLPLAVGIVFSMCAFSLFLAASSLSVNLGMFFIQASYAFVDLYLVYIVITTNNPIKTAGYLFATVCIAILGGQMISLYTQKVSAYLTAAGNIILTVSVLIMYFTGEWRKDTYGVSKDIQDQPLPTAKYLPRGIQKRLSDKEKSVLQHVIMGKTFRETAEELRISESSVKTYMKRIYEKTGVNGKGELLEKFSNETDSSIEKT